MQKNTQVALFKKAGAPDFRKKYRTVGLVMFLIAAGLLVIRLISYYISIEDPLLSDAAFTIPLQIGVLVIMPLLIYRFVLKMSFKEVFAFSNFRRTKWYNLLLMLPIGLCFYIATIVISGLWQSIIAALGYTHSSGSDLPETFNAGVLILSVFLTGILPAFCEEFANRGGFLTVMRKSYPLIPTLIIMGVQFGLFHQNITQIFYTMFFGAFGAFLTIKLKSIYPAMILHFVNNTFSVFNQFCDAYGWLGGGLNAAIEWGTRRMAPVVVLAFAVIMAVGVFLVVLLLHLNSAKRLAQKKEVVAESGFDHTHNRVVLFGEENKELVRELGLDKEVYGEKLKEDLFKPTLRDNAFYFGAAAMAVATTIFTFIFGAIV